MRLPRPVRIRPRGARVVDGRDFGSSLARSAWSDVQHGVLQTVYRRVPFLKSPFDIALYLQLLSGLRPRTVIEVGTKAGGSALFFADVLAADGVDARVISIDIDQRAAVDHPRVELLVGDAADLGAALPADLLEGIERPLLVVEDSAHEYETSRATLDFFDGWLASGDYIVIEDGIVDRLPRRRYRRFRNGPNRAVADFLRAHPGRYAIDDVLCDRYGYNGTYNPNGWLRRL